MIWLLVIGGISSRVFLGFEMLMESVYNLVYSFLFSTLNECVLVMAGNHRQ